VRVLTVTTTPMQNDERNNRCWFLFIFTSIADSLIHAPCAKHTNQREKKEKLSKNKKKKDSEKDEGTRLAKA
jgi:hypothetical protein